ncbi:major Facilitator Superfamily protein [Sphingomonas sp. S17]|jgi:DHA1 family inner membrane transport protein|uniref:MFS transporter n=2 Tax=Sphingomonas paucimobilis TaxID=13689 RepID=A0A411LFC1_SPHPI|nr:MULTISPECIES: MFS transporter [Sphingomonas]EGI55893.1 major Facilitator Superfamily protein [Sphingomonas sp. S17]MBQ1479800.1 MFS transporter [Sphingomonas sp.]MCM3679250.1 MFS transporter [Sphingomonas paucimobilis]MDG5972002.1 MFS transporter [Sphingomonas paucimobilis]NNG57989.1 MFS transporter [Sphingomonas paucimobilis]
MKFNLGLIALAVGAFGIGVTEFAPMGMLPVIAADLRVSIPAAGLLVSAYAMGVLVGAPLMTLTTGRIDRRTLLIALMGIFTLGNALSAAADGYWMLMAARIVTSFNHGAFFGVGSVVAASLVPPDKRAGAVAAMFTGLTVATIGGVPAATWVSEAVGWRSAFAGIAGVGAIAMLSLRLALPPLPAAEGGDMRAELRVLTRGPVVMALALTTIGFGGVFTVFTYIVPILRDVTHGSTGYVTAMLMLFGVGATIGNGVGGRLADRSVDRALMTMLAIMALTLLAFTVLMQWPMTAAITILIWGIASFAIVPPLQMRVMDAASDAPNLASAMNIGAFNLGNAIGAALGGGVIGAGLGLPVVSLAGAAMAAAALIMLLAFRRQPRARSCPV